MRKVTVLSVDYANNFKKQIGVVVERRKKYRPNNMMGLLVMARQMYSSNPQDAFQTILGSKPQYSHDNRREFMISVE